MQYCNTEDCLVRQGSNPKEKSAIENSEDCIQAYKTFSQEAGVPKLTVYTATKPLHLNP
jgi:hypothetical protein